MPTFDTPEPISVRLELLVGAAQITASDRRDTVVEVRPSEGSADADLRAAEQTQIDFTAGQLSVRAPKQHGLGLFGKPGSVDVTIDLPTGSHLRADASVAAIRSVGRLGDCQIKSSVGEVQLDQVSTLDVKTSAGGIDVDKVAGQATVIASSGRIRLREVDGSAVVKNSNGDCWIGEVGGDLQVNAANGDIAVDHAKASVSAITSRGDVRVGELMRGSADLKTAFGAIDVGICAGTAARLDVRTQFGQVRNQLDAADSPEPTEETAEVHASTSFGDIVIHHA